jgi:hypothetical protein
VSLQVAIAFLIVEHRTASSSCSTDFASTPKDRIVSFEDFRKLRVNDLALRSNRFVSLLTGELL